MSKAPNGRFVNMVKSVTISCNDPEDVKDGKPNYVFSAKQWERAEWTAEGDLDEPVEYHELTARGEREGFGLSSSL